MSADQIKSALLVDTVRTHHVADACRRFRDRSIEPLLIKGWSVSRFYPKNRIREYSDIDLCFDPHVYPEALKLANSEEFAGKSLDLHCALRDRDTVPWPELFSRSKLVETGQGVVRVLADEDNLRITCVHWLIDGGIDRTRLWDVYYMVAHRALDFDWDRCLFAAGPIRSTWVTAAIATARDYLDLDVSNVPESVRKFRLPAWYRRTLDKEWQLGPYLRVPIRLCLKRPRLLCEQIRRRFPPNSIAATVDVEAPINAKPRLPYRLRSVFKKISHQMK